MKKILVLSLLLISQAVLLADSNPSTWTSDSKKRHMWRLEDGPAYWESCNRDKNCKFDYPIYRMAYGASYHNTRSN